MSRIARVVVPGIPHHVTQRGNYQQIVFERREDRIWYLARVKDYSEEYGLKVWAYCLMNNHIHFIVLPLTADSMARTFRQVHMLYSQYFNRERGRTGHLWQGRFYSCLLDDAHLFAGVRYVERNPVRMGLVKRAEDYPWSSARAHVRGTGDPLLSNDLPLLNGVSDWKSYLSEHDEGIMLERIRNCTFTGRPAGSESFVSELVKSLGRELPSRPVGRPKAQSKVS